MSDGSEFQVCEAATENARSVVSVSTYRSRDGLETHERLISSKMTTSLSRLGLDMSLDIIDRNAVFVRC